VKIEVVKQNGWCIRFIDNPSEIVKEEAVKQNKLVINYVNIINIKPFENINKFIDKLL
jgi:hypothetical protein